MRTHAELIELVLKHFDEHFFSGLCWVVQEMRRQDLLTITERYYLIQLLHDNAPEGYSRSSSWYYWPYGEKEPRIQWLNNQLNRKIE